MSPGGCISSLYSANGYPGRLQALRKKMKEQEKHLKELQDHM